MMRILEHLSCASMLLACLVVMAANAQDIAGVNQVATRKTCDQLRQEMLDLLQRAYDRKIPPELLKYFLPNWIDFSLLIQCGKRNRSLKDLSSFSSKAATTLGKSGITRASETVAREKRETDEDNLINVDTLLRNKRSVQDYDFANHIESGVPMYRKKRFAGLGYFASTDPLLSMSLSSPGHGTGKEVSESAQMMNSMLMFTRLQKQNLAREYGRLGRQRGGYVGERVSFGTGIYGDTYPGRRRREAVDARSSAPLEAKSRRKRFLFGAEPAEGLTSPSLFNIMLGTATDPNTGKRIEFGGDFMQRSMTNTFMAFMPPGLQPAPGKEPGDMIQRVAPLWLFSNFGSSGNGQTRKRNGLYGDQLPGKKRRRRATGVINAETAPVEIFTAQEQDSR